MFPATTNNIMEITFGWVQGSVWFMGFVFSVQQVSIGFFDIYTGSERESTKKEHLAILLTWYHSLMHDIKKLYNTHYSHIEISTGNPRSKGINNSLVIIRVRQTLPWLAWPFQFEPFSLEYAMLSKYHFAFADSARNQACFQKPWQASKRYQLSLPVFRYKSH